MLWSCRNFTIRCLKFMLVDRYKKLTDIYENLELTYAIIQCIILYYNFKYVENFQFHVSLNLNSLNLFYFHKRYIISYD